MHWLNPPRVWREQDGRLTVTADKDTDAWRVTRHDYIVDNAHFNYQEVEGDFTVGVKILGQYAGLYDQAGLMLRENERVWMKCGVEYLDGVQQASAVITRDFSDWSIAPLAGQPSALWLRVVRVASAVEVYYALDGASYTLIRQGYLSAAPRLLVGMMCAAPRGDGFEVTFEDFRVSR